MNGPRSDRDETARGRDEMALRRDQSSTLRDQVADGRDREAARLDARDEAADRHAQGVEELRGRGRSTRQRGAEDRAHAHRDREWAGGDRLRAAHDRDVAGTDELTGAKRRGAGLEALDNEMQRARRESDGLVAAYIDVDGLKIVNDERGHAAGDALLREVADGFRRHMRPYDLFVRLGGDEFLCALPGVSEAEARRRFEGLAGELEEYDGSSVTVGYSELRDGDSANDLVRRADAAMLARRRA